MEKSMLAWSQFWMMFSMWQGAPSCIRMTLLVLEKLAWIHSNIRAFNMSARYFWFLANE